MTAPSTSAPDRPTGPSDGGDLEILLVEDDEGDAFLVEELLLEAEPMLRLAQVRSLTEATTCLPGRIDCVMVDLGLPDATGLRALEVVRELAPQAAVVVLTGLDDVQRALDAMAAGAQDYLVKGQVDGAQMGRAIRYAVERRRSEAVQVELHAAQLLMAENARLERGLLAVPLVDGAGVEVTAASRPGRERTLLGGDFYDVVHGDDGRVHALIGDVCGHGADEAALGVCLRIAWRALVLSGLDPDSVLRTVEDLLVFERRDAGLFATACMVTLSPSRAEAEVRLAGHPSPIVLTDEPRALREVRPRVPLGLAPGLALPSTRIALAPGSALLLMTDGIFEGRVGDGEERLGEDGLLRLVGERVAAAPDWRTAPREFVDGLIARAQQLNGGELTDDLALLLVVLDR